MYKFLLFAVLVHLVLLISIFDIYFTSPVISNLPSINISLPPPADRLVLLVTDGARIDKLFSKENVEDTDFIR